MMHSQATASDKYLYAESHSTQSQSWNIIGLTKKFSSKTGTVDALKDVSLVLRSGEITALLGPNGAGKTTLIKIIAGLIIPDHGTVAYAAHGSPSKEYAQRPRIGCMLEGTRQVYWRLTVRENMEYFGVLRGMTFREIRTGEEELLYRYNLSNKANSLASTLSRGMQQKLALICCLIGEPDLLILDEPTLGMDLEACDIILETIQQVRLTGVSVLLATHQLDIAQKLANQIAIISGGQMLACASTRELLTRQNSDHFLISTNEPLSEAHWARALSCGAKRLSDCEALVPPDPQLLGNLVAALPKGLLKSISLYEFKLEDLVRQLTRKVPPSA